MMRVISTVGFDRPKAVNAGAPPSLRWLPVADLLLDSGYRGPFTRKGREKVNRIAAAFSWTCFAPVVVAPVEEAKFVILDGGHRATAAAVAGFDHIPCQIVAVTRAERCAASKILNGNSMPASRMALHAAGVIANDEYATQMADICARAEVEVLRYPVPVDRQTAGQTMAVGAIAQCLRRYGEETLITALQCVTQTANNRPGALSARMIKALCAVLDHDRKRRDSGLALLEAFDAIDLAALQNAASIQAEAQNVSAVTVLADHIRTQLVERFRLRSEAPMAVVEAMAIAFGETSLAKRPRRVLRPDRGATRERADR
jgi:ParB-like nuclease domain